MPDKERRRHTCFFKIFFMNAKVCIFKIVHYTKIAIIGSCSIIYADNDGFPVTLMHVLSFFTGAERVPPLGFSSVEKPHLTFNYESPYATASTCALQLCLPTKYFDKPDVFQDKMITSFRDHGGFGAV